MKNVSRFLTMVLAVAGAAWAVTALAAKPAPVSTAIVIAAAEKTGACVYSIPSKVTCAVLTKSNCDTLKGAWTEGGKCPGDK